MSQKNDASDYGLNGKVKTVKSQIYSLIIEKDTFRIGEKENGLGTDRNSLLEFDERGNLISSKEFLSNGKISDEVTQEFDKENRLVNRKEVDNYGKGSFLDYKYIYNSADSLTQVMISGNDFKRIHQIERDENNQPIKHEVIQSDTVYLTYIAKYDNNNMISEKEFRYDTIPVKLIERTFNEQNLKEKERIIEYKSWDTLHYSNIYVYDNKKNLIHCQYNIENDSVYNEVKNSYHENGELKQSIWTPKGSLYYVVSIEKYNQNGNLVERSRLPSDGDPKQTWNYKYKYDTQNNWIERINFKNDKPLRIVKRTIEYFE